MEGAALPSPDPSRKREGRSVRLSMMRSTPVAHRAPCVTGASDRAASFACRDMADPHHGFARHFKRICNCCGLISRHNHRHADPAIEGAGHFFGLDIALRLKESHQTWLRPKVCIHVRMQALGQDARDIFKQAAAGDMRHRIDLTAAHQRQQGFHIDARRRH